MLVALMLLAGCPGDPEPTPDVRTVDTLSGAHTVTYTPSPDPIPFNDFFDLVIDVDADDIAVDATMPAHGHGMNVVPTVTSDGDGLWTVEGMLFHMTGEWELVVTVDPEGAADDAVFTVHCCS